MTNISRSVLLATLIAAAFAAEPTIAQGKPESTKLTVNPLKGGAYWVSGGRAITGFVVGRTGVIVIDAHMTEQAARQHDALIARVTPKPIRQLILTHGDPDHVVGIAFYQNLPTTMHENTRAKIVAGANDPEAPGPMKPLYASLMQRLPGRTLHKTTTVTLDGVRMILLYPGLAHTAGDLVIYLPTQRIVYGGDMLVNTARFPVIHTGGSSLGWIEGMKTLLALDADVFVPGHGAIETRTQLQGRVRDAETRREAIKRLVYQGRSLAEVQAALPEKADVPQFLSYTETVYAELARGYPPAIPPWDDIIRR